ncbi:hypothetical protein LJR030_001756 [Rhizobium sp. LjRoot30]|uniref:hypothetical protein n=1 Tax=Rhizobium sp. LjRoot30 TaxID=3342320 RepID=UPI003ECD54B4
MAGRYAVGIVDAAGNRRTFVVETLGCENDVLIVMRNGLRERLPHSAICEFYPIDINRSSGQLPPASDDGASVFDLCF